MKYRGIIRNKEGEAIFSRQGNFTSPEHCLEALHARVLVDIPDEHSLLYNMLHGGGFENSPYCLKRHYTDVSELTFEVLG